MSAKGLLSLDHVGLAIENLELARQAYERLGFSLSTRSIHSGSVISGGPVVPWGSGNHCAMFRNGYFELLGLIDANKHSSVKSMLTRYSGLHIVAMDCESADYVFKILSDMGIPLEAPRTLERDATFGFYDEEVKKACFRNVYLDQSVYSEARFIIIEHKTRPVLWQPHLLHHQNGASDLEAVYFIPEDIESTRNRFYPLVGTPTKVKNVDRYALKRGKLYVLDEKKLHKLAPVFEGYKVNPVAAVRIRVNDLSKTIDFLKHQKISLAFSQTFDNGDPCVWVDPDAGLGAAIEFTE